MEVTLQNYIKAGKTVCWRTMERLTGINYYSARTYYMYKLFREKHLYKGQSLLIYQMGKVGSKTIMKSLQLVKLDMPIHHVHYLTKDLFAKKEQRCKKYFRSDGFLYNDPKALWRWLYLRKQINKSLNEKKFKIVTLVRDPIAVNISDFFHHVDKVEFLDFMHYCKIKSYKFDYEITFKLQNIETLVELFLEKKMDHNFPLTFFDTELKAVFGFDVYASEFPQSKGYKIYEGKRADVLLIRLENLNECARDAFKEFLNIDSFNLVDQNIGIEKPYAILYKKFKDSIIFPDSYTEKMYSSKYMKHFYSKDEIEKFRKKWRN